MALTRRDDTEHFLLLHYPATVMYKTKGTVNYLFGQNFVARQLRSLSPEALALYEKDVLAAHLTQTARCAKTGQLPVHEYTRQLILL